jgi:predicted small integral membrane protein
MIVRLSKCALLFGVAFFFSLVVFNNTTDYDSNYQFVRHVLAMDSTFPGNHGMWRSLHQPVIYTVFYLSVICWEATTAVLCWWGLAKLLTRIHAPAAVFHHAKQVAVIALTLGCMLWFIAFVDVGGEWFLMWQSKTWNGQDAAFRMFVMLGLTLIYLTLPEHEPDAA